MEDAPDREPPGLSVLGVRKSYGDVPVLHGVDLDVQAGSLTAVLGRSGCGKTTLLRLIAGFDRPDAGTIDIAGQPVAGPGLALPPEERRIGYVTQEGNLFPHLTVAANIAFGLPRRARRAPHRVVELLEMVGLDAGYARRHPHELSGGQQQRIALARALAPEPGIVLLDEPFSSLDVELRESTRRAVVDVLAAAGTTTVLVTHDQAEALSLASRVAVMRDGAIVQVASPAELYRHPVDRGVAGFVGDVVGLPATVHGGVAECVLGRLPVGGGHPDGPATVLLRPEQIGIHGIDAGGVTAQVLEIEYYGHDAVVRLELGGGTAVAARCPGYALPVVGQQVRLVVRGEVGLDRAPA
ncbi:ABC transporter ATP-binding protein [Pseudonocardia sp. K10HN5]|uniref:ABC transporter ATP-binding protein n=2 Tax=Pseudonocardia acidicola TaxID=2724939 RepID=A0ABX1SIE0_9PSEU|nr:ABC transporter ATP-binding protein [Pseudonocardia acidicola]